MPLSRRSALAAAVLALAVAAGAPLRAQGGAPAAAATPADDRAAVLAVVRGLFDGMRRGDSAAVRAAFHPQALLASAGERNGVPGVTIDSIAKFARAVGTPHADVWDERTRNEVVQVDGPLASVWVEYGFFAGARFSHCGVDAFQLARTEGGWKIVALVDTRRRTGCEQWQGAAPTAAPAPSGAAPVPAASAPVQKATRIILVRHAEKAAAPADDPALSEAGQQRARELAELLKSEQVTAIIVTPRRRTQETAAPVARASGVTPEVVPFGASTEAHVAAVAEAVRRHQGGTILVVGHSNTIPAIIGALGGPQLPELCDGQYAQLHRLELDPATIKLVTRSYGTPDAAGAAACHPSMRP